jgi:hypothetical protein
MKFQMRELIGTNTVTARLGTGDTASDRLTDKDAGKIVVLSGDSCYNLAAVGNKIHGRVVSIDTATSDGFSTGAVQNGNRFEVVFDGLEATPGTGSIAVGDYVVTGTPVAKGTALTTNPKVCKATNQPGTAVTTADNVAATINAALAKVADAQLNSVHAWRVVSILTGSGGVGSTGAIERVAV